MPLDFFSINFNQQAIDLLPPDKRLPKFVLLLQALFRSVQWARDMLFGSYKSGATAPAYSPGTYNQYDQVIYNKGVYESLISGNTTAPNTANWRLVVPNFIGVDQRIKFNAQKCVLEQALNLRFGGQFRMPPAPTPSDIYISNIAPVPYGFRVGNSIGSTVGNSISSDDIGSTQTFRQVNGYQINFPAALYALTSNGEIEDFVNQYNNSGINYTIVSY